MLIHKNSVYRHVALTLPSFDEVFRYELEQSSTFDTELEEAERYLRDEGLDQGIDEDTFYLEKVYNQAKDVLELAYSDIVSWIERINGDDCLRAIAVPEGTDPLTVNPLGIYWSMYSEGADTYWKNEENNSLSITLIYRGKIDMQNIDFLETIAVNIHNPEEHEVRFEEGAPIYVYDVTIIGGERWSHDAPENVLPINDWRKC